MCGILDPNDLVDCLTCYLWDEEEAGKIKEAANASQAPAPEPPRHVLMFRWHDRQRDTWTDWTEVEPDQLRNKYGAPVDEWKKSCVSWTDIGGTYDYKIVERTDREVWRHTYAGAPVETTGT